MAGRQWGELRSVTVEGSELAEALRLVVDTSGKTMRVLERAMPHSRSTISENLNGAKRPEWSFVESLVAACLPRDAQARQLHLSKLRPLWEAADPRTATLIPPTTEPELRRSDESMSAVFGQWLLEKVGDVAAQQELVVRAQEAVARNQVLVVYLSTQLARLNEIIQDLKSERDSLREQEENHKQLREELESVQERLAETQLRLEKAELLHRETARRLKETERQRVRAERLKDLAISRLRAIQALIPQDVLQPDLLLPSMDIWTDSGQNAPAETVLRQVDDRLADEADDLADIDFLAQTIGPNGRITENVARPPDKPETRADTARTAFRHTAIPKMKIPGRRKPPPEASMESLQAGAVTSVAFSPDGSVLVTGGPGGVQFWDLFERRKLDRPYPGQADAVTSVALSPDGGVLATGGPGGIRVWDLEAGAPVDMTFPPFNGPVAFGPNGRLLAAGGLGGTRLWDLAARAEAGQLEAEGSTDLLTFSPDGVRLVSACRATGVVLAWEITSGQHVGGPLTGDTERITSLGFSPDGRYLATASVNSGGVQLWDATVLELVERPLRKTRDVLAWVVAIAFRSDGRLLASGYDNGTVRLWDVAERTQSGKPLKTDGGKITSLAFNPNGNMLAIGTSSALLLVSL